MSVIGIDFGNDSCYIAVARQGGIETVDNDYSLRATPSCVGFGEKQRILGVAGKNQLVTNLANTVYDFKRFIGRQHSDPFCKEMASLRTYHVVPTSDGQAGVSVNYAGSERVFSMQQIGAMLLTKLKQTTEHALGTKISDCVISCPSFFTNVERESILGACQMAGLNVLRLLNDTTSSALNYVFYRQDLPEKEEPSRNVVFVDCGHSALQVFACAFNKGSLKMLATASDPHIGGRNFDNILAQHFVGEFKKKYNLDASTNKRALIRLLSEVEKLKKQMSANSTVLPLNIESFMKDVDVTATICRADFEGMCATILKRVETTLLKCLKDCGLSFDEIHSVEIIGGSSRIPSIKQLIENTFKKVPSTTLNQDEAVARGCAIQCAILSPTFRVKDINIIDIQPYPITLIFDPASGSNGEMQLFPRFHPIPFTKIFTLYRRGSFTVQVAYDSETPFPDHRIGEYKINNIAPSADGENTKVKIKTQLDMNGTFCIKSATAYEKGEEVEVPVYATEEPMEVENGNRNEDASASGKSPLPDETSKTAAAEDVPMASDATTDLPAELTSAPVPEEKKVVSTVKKQQYKSTSLRVDSNTNSVLSPGELLSLIEAEDQMVAEDRKEKDRIDVKNALEEYVYNLRDKLDGDYREFVTEAEKRKMIDDLNDLETWLYEDGEDQERSVYSRKLEELKKFGDGVKHKLDEVIRKKMEEEQAKLNPPPAPESEIKTAAGEEGTQPHPPTAEGKSEDKGIEIPIQHT